MVCVCTLHIIHFSNLINDNDLLIASIIAQVHTYRHLMALLQVIYIYEYGHITKITYRDYARLIYIHSHI